METLLIFLLKNTVCAGILLLYYHLALRNKKFHYYNRFYLLAIVATSLLLPFLNIRWFTVHSSNEQVVQLFNIIYTEGGEKEVVNRTGSWFSWSNALPLFALAASCVLLLVQWLKVLAIFRLKKRYPTENLERIDIINTDLPQAPFSFLNNLFWRNDILLSEETGQQIFRHELTHIKQKHTWDKLFMQVVLCFCWMNPFYWLIRRELFLIHEFIADEKAVGDKDAGAFAAMLLRSQFSSFAFAPAHPFAYSPVKRRLQMLTGSHKASYSYVRRLMILPLLLLVTGLFAFRIAQEQAEEASVAVAQHPFKLVVDAGHGGTDMGTYGANNAVEKDFTLLIARKIKALSPEYGIDVVLTRDADKTVPLQDRTRLAASEKANAFVSLHLNAQHSATKNLAGMEVYISEQNGYARQSSLMGSTLISSLSSSFTIKPALLVERQPVWVLKHAAMPAVLIECGYITNASDLAEVQNENRLTLLARKILAGIALYANQPATAAPEQPGIPLPAAAAGETSRLNKKRQTAPAASDKSNITVTNTELVQGRTAPGSEDAAQPAARAYQATATPRLISITLNNSTPAPRNDSAQIELPQDALYILDGKITNVFELKQLNPSAISRMSVFKGKSAILKYGMDGKNGAIEIYTKQGDRSDAGNPVNAF